VNPNIADTLSGRAGLAGIQWLLLDTEPHEALRTRQLNRFTSPLPGKKTWMARARPIIGVSCRKKQANLV